MEELDIIWIKESLVTSKRKVMFKGVESVIVGFNGNKVLLRQGDKSLATDIANIGLSELFKNK